MYPIRSLSSLKQVAKTLSLRCDAKQTEPRFLALDAKLNGGPVVFLSSFLPENFVKGKQPIYVEDPSEETAFVVSTLAVQPLSINARACRLILKEEYDKVGNNRHLRDGDILLTMDGGTSIGKAAVFDKLAFAEVLEVSEDDLFVTVDSHVAILRPVGITPLALAYLLASPIGQLQFQRAESGASGQTGVTEDDVRHFRFPAFDPDELQKLVSELQESLNAAKALEVQADAKRRAAWDSFEARLAD